MATKKAKPEPKSFTFCGMNFEPIRKFKVYENFAYVSKHLNSGLGVHNYDKDVRRHKIVHWNYDDFYSAAKGANSGEFDIFLLNGVNPVVPCKNELFLYKEPKTLRELSEVDEETKLISWFALLSNDVAENIVDIELQFLDENHPNRQLAKDKFKALSLSEKRAAYEESLKSNFEIEICRTSYSFHTVTVRAINREEASELAYQDAGDHDYNEKSAEYSINSCNKL